MEREQKAPATPERPTCPFCGGGNTEVMSLFGSHASLTTYWCAACRSPFERLRWRDTPDDEPPGEPGPD